MSESESLTELFEHLERTTGLSAALAQRVVDEVLTYFSESLEEFVVRRHGELQAENLRNEEIFERIRGDIRARRFHVGDPTARQIRRLVYG